MMSRIQRSAVNLACILYFGHIFSAFGNSFLIGVGLHGQVWRSEDGLAWERANGGDEGEHLNAMIWDGKQFLGIGLGATHLSDDGRSWDRTSNQNAPLSAVRGSNGL